MAKNVRIQLGVNDRDTLRKNGGVPKTAPTKTSKGKTTKTSVGQETVEETVARAKALLGTAYNPNTPAPSNARMTEIANQSFVDPEIRKKVLATLPKTQPPTNAGQMQYAGTQPYTAPDVTPSSGNISEAAAGIKGYEAMLKAQQLYQEQQMQIEEQRRKENASLFDKMMGGVTSPSEARADAWDDTGIDVQDYFAKQEAGIQEINALTEDYNALVAAKDQQLAATQDKMASMNFINNQAQQIERNAAPQLNRLSANINAKAATLQAQQGNFAEAQAYVNQAVQDATADTKFKFDMFTAMYQMNQDSFDRIDTIYKDAFEGQMKIAEAAYLEQKAEKESIGQLMLNYPTAGIRMDDTLEQAFGKAGLVAPTLGSGTDGLTADMKNYLFAKDQGYTGSFADWNNKNGGNSLSETDALAMSLYLGEIGIGDVPSDLRNATLSKYHEMQALQQKQAATQAPTSNTSFFSKIQSGASTAVNAVGSYFMKLFGY